MKLKIWFLETRPQFLLLSVVLAFLGTCIAWYDDAFHLGYALLAFFVDNPEFVRYLTAALKRGK